MVTIYCTSLKSSTWFNMFWKKANNECECEKRRTSDQRDQNMIEQVELKKWWGNMKKLIRAMKETDRDSDKK